MIVHFEPRSEFSTELQQRVSTFLSTRDPQPIRRRMLLKTAIILAWMALSYVGLVFVASEWWQALLLSTSLGLAMAGTGFSIQHDANHGAYPVSKRWRRALGFLLDLMGGSSYLWKYQHNINHHTFTNVADADNDISIGRFARLAPTQAHHAYHRFQHVYLWPFYSLLGLSWSLWADWRDLLQGAIGTNSFPRPRGLELFGFWLGKALWAIIWLVIPLALHSAPVVFGFIAWTYLVLGFTMAIVFQLAHIVEEAHFPNPSGQPAQADSDFMSHQLATTVNFSPRNPWLNWYLGGLNFQVEHHLFPRVCHIDYPAIAPIVERVCQEHGVPYRSLPTFRAALASHVRWLRLMGRPPDAETNPSAARVASAPST